MSMNREGFKGSSDDFRITFDNGYTVSVVWGAASGRHPFPGCDGRYAMVECFDPSGEKINMSRESWPFSDSPGDIDLTKNDAMYSIWNATPRDVAQVINFICSK